jgi:hypothetical protein
MSDRHHAVIETRVIEVTPVEGPQHTLVQVSVTCPLYGIYQLWIPSSHLHGVVTALQDVATSFPEMSEGAELQLITAPSSEREDH